MTILQPREIIPWGHQVFLEGQTKPHYIDCTLGACRICKLGECAKNMKLIDEIIKGIWGKK